MSEENIAEEKKGFRIESLDQAIRFAHALHRHRQAQQEIIAGADKSIQALLAEIAVIEDWRDSQVGEIQIEHCLFLEGALRTWHREQYEAQPKGNTKKELPFVTLKRKGGTLSTEVDNSELFVKWAKDNMPELVRETEPKPAEELPDLKEVLKAAGDKGSLTRRDDGTLVTADGEIVEGIRVVKGDDEFVVEVS